jgi:hypothetical protein
MSVKYKRKHQMRRKEESIRSPTFIYMTSCRKVKGRKIVKRNYPYSKGEEKVQKKKRKDKKT